MLWLTASFLPASRAAFTISAALRERERRRLLGEDALDVRPLDGLLDDPELLVGRVRDVDDLDTLVVEQLLPGVVHRLDAVLLRGRPAFAGVRDASATTLKPASL